VKVVVLGGGGGGTPGGGTGGNPNAPKTMLWGLDRIDQATGRDGRYGSKWDGTGVHVYVVDTGVNDNHQDFEGRADRVVDTHKGGKPVFCDPANPGTCARDENGHGSHCAGTVAGKTVGVAKKAFIHGVKVLKANPGTTMNIQKGINWVMRNGKRPAVMSISLGSNTHSEGLNTTIWLAHKAGILSVIAAGNDKFEACKQTPAHVTCGLIVGATNKNDGQSDYSNWGSCVDIWAPGDYIKSCHHASNTGWKDMSGTSMATPHVSGVAALLLQANPKLTPDELTAEILGYATKDVVKFIRGRTAGSPNLMLRVTTFTTTKLPEIEPIKPGRRRRRSKSSARRRRRSKRKGSSRRRRRSKKSRRRTPKTRRRRAPKRRRSR